jgi:hypothetical protein
MQPIDRSLQNLIGTLFPIIGATLLLGAAFATVSTNRFIASATRAEGTVIRVNASGAHPVIQFKPTPDSVVEFSRSGFIHYTIGDQVTVLYVRDAQEPSGFQVNIDTPGALWVHTIVLTGVGIGMIGGGLYMRGLNNHDAK